MTRLQVRTLPLVSAKVRIRDNVGEFVGKRSNLTTYNLARINYSLHDVSEKFDIAHGDTLIDPQHWIKNHLRQSSRTRCTPSKWEGDANPLLINDARFAPAGVAPKSAGRPGVHVHPVVVIRQRNPAIVSSRSPYRGGAETQDPQTLIDNNVDAVIQLPADFEFFATCIVLKSPRPTVPLFIDASAEFNGWGTRTS